MNVEWDIYIDYDGLFWWCIISLQLTIGRRRSQGGGGKEVRILLFFLKKIIKKKLFFLLCDTLLYLFLF